MKHPHTKTLHGAALASHAARQSLLYARLDAGRNHRLLVLILGDLVTAACLALFVAAIAAVSIGVQP